MNIARIQNFRGIRDLAIALSPTLTALVGPNGCGKSRVLAGMDASASSSGRIRLYDFDPVQLGRAARLFHREMEANGFGLPATVGYLQARHSKNKTMAFALRDALWSVSPELKREGIRVDYEGPLGDPGKLAWLYRLDGGKPLNISDSALLALGIFTAVYSAKPGDLVLFENLERGIYFRSLPKLVKELELACDRLPGLQIVFSTHSMDLLDHMQPEQVRMLTATDNGDVECLSLTDHPEFTAWRDCSPGEIVSILGPK